MMSLSLVPAMPGARRPWPRPVWAAHRAFTANLDSIALMPCNPAIGGIAKGHLVREIDALGGEMARCIDQTGFNFVS